MKDYGTFTLYDHTAVDGHPFQSERVACLKNEKGQDYYDLRNWIVNNVTEKKLYLVVHPGDNMVALGVYDLQDAFPQDYRLVAVDPLSDGVDLKSLQGKTLLETGEIVDFVMPELNIEPARLPTLPGAPKKPTPK